MSGNTGSARDGRFDDLTEHAHRDDQSSLQEPIDGCLDPAGQTVESCPESVGVERTVDPIVETTAPLTGGPRPSFGLIGDYRILREVGRGGMGVVYEAEQVSLGRRVALKVLPRPVARDATILERFRREARAAARLHHTNIVPVYEVGDDGGVQFYAMQFIEGQSLDSVIDELRRLRERLRPLSSAGGAAAGVVADRRSRDGRFPVVATLPDGLEVSQVVRSILVGQFGPDRSAAAPRESAGVAVTRAAAATLAPASVTFNGPPAPEPAGATLPEPAEFQRNGPRSGREPEPTGETWPSSPPPLSAILPGGTQISTVDSGRRKLYRSLAQIGRQVAGGLAHAHARGIIHRDIKPSNLLLDADGVVWIADFGLAKGEEEGLTHSGDILGTLRYMAPERFRGQGDARSDIYALGLTLYELLTLRPGFDMPDRIRLIERIQAEEPPRPRSLDPRIPRDLETIVLKAIEKDPKARYQTAEAMGEDLRRFIADEPILARQVTAVERYWRWARRNPVVAVLGGVITAMLIVVTALSFWSADYFRRSAERERFANAWSRASEKSAIESRQQAIAERDRSRRLSAGLALDRGIAQAEEGRPEQGLLWMLEALRAAPNADGPFRAMVRRNIGAWLGQIHQPIAIVPLPEWARYPVFTSDGKSFAMTAGTIENSGSVPIRLWDTATGKPAGTIPGCFLPFAFRPDGQTVFGTSANSDRVVAVDVETGRELWSVPREPGRYRWVAPSPDGKFLLVFNYKSQLHEGMLSILDASTGRLVGDPMRVGRCFTISPDGRTVATTHRVDNRDYIDLIEWPSRRSLASWPASQGFVESLVFSPDGRSLYEHCARRVTRSAEHFGRIRDVRSGQPISPLMRVCSHGCFTPAGDRLITGAGGTFAVRDPLTARVRGTGPPVTGLAIDMNWQAVHDDGRIVVSSDGKTATVWRLASDAEPAANRQSDDTSAQAEEPSRNPDRDPYALPADLSPDGRYAVKISVGMSRQEVVRCSDPLTGRPIGRPARHARDWIVRAVAFSPDGRLMATGGYPPGVLLAGEVRLWDCATGRQLFHPMPHTNYVATIAFRPDGKVFAAGDYHGLVRLRDSGTGREVASPLPQGAIPAAMAYSPDGRLLAVGLHRTGTRLWDAVTHQPFGQPLSHDVSHTHVEFRPDSRVLVAGDEVRSRLWDVVTCQPVGEPIVDEAIGGFLPDGRTLLTLGRDGGLRLRDSGTAALVRRVLTVPAPATCAAFRGRGDLIAVGCEDGTVRLCDPVAAQAVGPPRLMRHPVLRVAFSADGRTVVAVDEVGETGAWPVPEPADEASLDDLTLRIEARTGLRLEQGRSISRLDYPEWRERLDRLDQIDPSAARPADDASWHEPMIREAEQLGNAFAAAWHLDRLIAARPGDWLLYARRGRARTALDQYDEAAADFRQAERLGSRDSVLDFQAHRLVDCTVARRWDEALWYADRLVAARPDDWALREDRAAIYAALGRDVDRLADLVQAVDLGADRSLVLPLAEQSARAGRWAEAAAWLERCRQGQPTDNALAQAEAVLMLRAHDLAGYRAVRAAVVARHGAGWFIFVDLVSDAEILALGVGDPGDDRKVLHWLSRVIAANSSPPIVPGVGFSVMGAMLVRGGRLDEAIVRLGQAEEIAQRARLADYSLRWAYLALAHARKGNSAEARRWLARLSRWTATARISYWEEQKIALVREEAETALLDAVFPRDPFTNPRP